MNSRGGEPARSSSGFRALGKEARRPPRSTLRPTPDEQLLAPEEALNRLTALEPQQAELGKLRYFVDLKIDEAAEVLGISLATAKRWWAYARAWLFEEIDGSNK